MLVVTFQGEASDFFQVLRIPFHVRGGHAKVWGLLAQKAHLIHSTWKSVTVHAPKEKATGTFSWSQAKQQFNAQFGPCRLRHRANREAHLLMPPFRRTNGASGSASVLYSAAYRSTRAHLDRV